MLRCSRSSWLLSLVALAFPSFCRLSEAAEWFVAPSGQDEAVGSLERPFATVQRAQTAAQAGDTIYLRGGVYRLREEHIAHRDGIFAAITYLNKSGTAGQPITYAAYADEHPTFDCSEVKPADMRIDAFHITGSYLHLRGFAVTGVQVTIRKHTQSICFENDGSHNLYERLQMHDGQAIGIYSRRGSDNLFLNCDAWNNWDYTSEDGKGGNVDGFGCHPPKGSTGNVFLGCRAWFNSDDGFDCLGAAEAVTFDQCWAFYNGFDSSFQRLADGNGFKAGGYGNAPAERLPKIIPRHLVRGCLAVGNKNSGFYANHHPGGCDWALNTAYRNGINFNLLGRLLDNHTDIDGRGHKLHRNVSYGSRIELARIELPACDLQDNCFASEQALSSKDFRNLDEAELFRLRQENGNLPSMDFLAPKTVATWTRGAFHQSP